MIPLISGRCFAGCSGLFPGAFFTPSDQISFIHVESANRRRVSRREQFLETTDVTIPWSRRIGLIDSFTYSGHRGRKPNALKTMLRMHLPRVWFSLSDGGVEDAVCDAHARRRLMTLDFTIEQVSDVTRVLHSRHLLETHDLDRKLLEPQGETFEEQGSTMRGSVSPTPRSSPRGRGRRTPPVSATAR